MNPQIVSTIMRDCGPVVVTTTITLREAAERLICSQTPLLIAVDAAQKLEGVIPESAVIRQLMQTSRRTETIDAILSRHVETIRAESDLTSVLPLFRSSCNCVLPVVDDSDRIVGLVHRSDVVRLLIEVADDAEDVQKPHLFDKRERSKKSEPLSDDPSES